MVALTGIEGTNSQFSSVQLGLSDSKYAQLVWQSAGKPSHRILTLSLGCHSALTIALGGSRSNLARACGVTRRLYSFR